MTRKEEILKEVHNRSSYNGFHADEFIQGVEWADTTMLKKAEVWLRSHPSSHYDDLEEFSKAFVEAMENYT